MLRVLLKQNDYQLDRYPWGIKISSNNESQWVWWILAVISGAILGYYAFQGGSWKMGLLAIILIGVPFTSHALAGPLAIIFNQDTNKIIIQKPFGQQTIGAEDSPELIVDYHNRSSFVSPFEEGYQDHYYTFKVSLAEKQVPLFRLKSRKRIDGDVEKVLQELTSAMPFW